MAWSGSRHDHLRSGEPGEKTPSWRRRARRGAGRIAALVATKGMKNPPEQDRAFSEMLEKVMAKAVPDAS